MCLIIMAIIVFINEFDKEGKQWRDREYQECRKYRAEIYGDDRRTPGQFKQRMRERYGYTYDMWCIPYDEAERKPIKSAFKRRLSDKK